MALHGAQVTAMTQGKAGGFWILSSSRSLEMQAESAEAAAEWIKLLQDTANRVDFSPQVPGAGSRRGSQEPTPAPLHLYSDTLEKESSGAEAAPEEAGEVQEGAEEQEAEGGEACGALKTVRL